MGGTAGRVMTKSRGGIIRKIDVSHSRMFDVLSGAVFNSYSYKTESQSCAVENIIIYFIKCREKLCNLDENYEI